MTDTDGETDRDALRRAMARPDFYPHPTATVERRETHISEVFLAGDFAYKIKKPVDLGFLDFGTPEKRRRICDAEVRLNRRLAVDVYLGVVPVTRSRTGFAVDGDGPAAEYAVRMRRLPEARAMPALLERGEAADDDLDRLAGVLADFYAAAPVRRDLGGPETVRENCAENFRQMRPLAPDVLRADRLADLRDATRAFLRRRADRFAKRRTDGAVRECHGDLRAEHVYFLPEGIRIIDCVEFNERMRVHDAASDLAFLLMDLEYRGFGRAADALLKRDLAHRNDFGMLALLDFYRCYRACVRLKVSGFRLMAGGLSDARRRETLDRIAGFAELAVRYARRMDRPILVAVAGPIAAGKSTVASALGTALDAPVFRTDAVRREMFGTPGGDPSEREFGEGIYRAEAIDRVYAEVVRRSTAALGSGESVVLDATFGRRERRDALRRAVREANAPLLFAECVCPEAAIRARLKRRERAGEELSDARPAHFEAFRRNYEPPTEIPERERLRIEGDGSTAAAVADVFLASRKRIEDFAG